MGYKFRIDDVSINCYGVGTVFITTWLMNKFPGCEVIYGVSPMVHNSVGKRVFPKEFTAMSDYKNFYMVETCGIPKMPNGDKMDNRATIASHGMIHVDHRLLTKECQEMSILVSCSLLKSEMFIPPFNKWNKDTEDVCKEHGIELIKWEDGWRSAEHNKFSPDITKWYFHERDFGMHELEKWLQ